MTARKMRSPAGEVVAVEAPAGIAGLTRKGWELLPEGDPTPLSPANIATEIYRTPPLIGGSLYRASVNDPRNQIHGNTTERL